LPVRGYLEDRALSIVRGVEGHVEVGVDDVLILIYVEIYDDDDNDDDCGL